jgi:copper transport protein
VNPRRWLLAGALVAAVLGGWALAAGAMGPDAGGRGPWQLAATAARWTAYTGMLLAAGGVVFLCAVHDRTRGELAPLRRVVAWASVVAALATLAGIPLQAALVTGRGMAAWFDVHLLTRILGTGFGTAALLRVLGLAVILFAVGGLWQRWAVWTGLAGGAAAVASTLFTGHTVTTEPAPLVMAATFVHTAAAATWFGGLVLLGWCLWRRREPIDPEGGAAMVARFSILAMGSVAALVAAGAALSWAEVRALRALTTTGYGVTLLVKMALVVAVLGLAAYNQRRLVPAIRRRTDDAAGAWRHLTRTVRLESIGIVAVLAVTALLVNLVPARTAAGIGQPFAEYAELGPDLRLLLVVDPAEAGRNEVHLYLSEASGLPADVAEGVLVRLQSPDEARPGVEREPLDAGPGHWVLVGSEIDRPGTWLVEVEASTADGDRTTTFEVPVGGRAP